MSRSYRGMALLALSTMFCGGLFGATFSFSGTFTSDADVAFINLTLASNTVITVQSYGYGGSTGLGVAPGGFAGTLSMYDSAGDRQAYDPFGGTVVLGVCSHAGSPDPVTGFCVDPSLAFSGVVGNYLLALSLQGNDGPAVFADGFLLAPGTNFPGGPFLDPTDPTGLTVRNGNWYLQVSLDGSADTGVPEPGSVVMSAIGLATLLLVRRRNHV